MSIRLARDTVETVQVRVVDDSQQVDDLSATTPTYDVTLIDGTPVDSDVAANAVDMTIYCLLDTTTWSDDEDEFYLYVTFEIGDEAPRLGPFVILLT